MAEARSASSHPCFHEWPVEDQRPLTLLRRLVIEIEDSIAQSRAVSSRRGMRSSFLSGWKAGHSRTEASYCC
jgi:hypothetical protein